ncbi:hypothetical protein [Streptomyces sp. SID2888]|uniref:hypothetical protein n=1 Tax=Streptomyces sp. SID2888 TaxID=2690256 RepID=UPI00136926AE|nr:hypothetical protein [Streptomyces sp. SID2888]MYV45213.1 hypothetical protein [Streptomyces sp. SID2888]
MAMDGAPPRRFKKKLLPTLAGALLVAWIAAIVVGIAREPDPHSGAPSKENLAASLQSAVKERDPKKIEQYFSDAAGDGYAESLLSQLEDRSAPVSVALHGDQLRISADTAGCMAFGILHQDGRWLVDPVPALSGCR